MEQERRGPGFHATIIYLRASSVAPRADSDDPSRSVMPTEEVRAFIHDLRGAAPPSLDEEGFALIDQRTAVRDFTDPDELDRVYLPEAEELVRAATGASAAWSLPRPVLRSERHGHLEGGVVRDRTAPMPHVDYPSTSIPFLIGAAEQRMGRPAPPWRRFRLYNLWRSLSEPPQDRPLALCDLRTVDARDLVSAEAIANPGALAYSTEFQMLLPNPRHRWCYFSDMTPGDVLLFQQVDSAATGPSGCPHTSVSAPRAKGAVPRLSLEVRVCAFFD